MNDTFPVNALRRCCTGVNEYCFYRGDSRIGEAAALVLPGFPVRIHADRLHLRYGQEPEQTVFPGCHTPLVREDTGQVWGRVVWNGFGNHSYVLGQDSLRVISRAGVWHFFRGDTMLAVLRSVPAPLSDGWERRLELTAPKNLTHEQLVLLMCFPLLQIGP